MAITTYYPYDPNKVLPIVFGVIVLLLSVAILYQCARRRWWHFGSVMIWASSVWIAGFICREISVFNTANLGLFIAQYVMIFAGPPLFATAETFILGRLLAYLPYFTPVHPGRIIWVFMWLNAAVEALAISGASAAANAHASPSAIASALARVKASLILQEFVETMFCTCVALVEYRCRKAGRFPHNIKIVCRVLYVTSAMMMIRCILRIVEGFEASSCNGNCPVEQNEWYLWVFEVANITVFIAGLAIWHPSRYLPSDNKIYLDPTDGITERYGPGFTVAQDRPWISTWVDPLDFAGMIKGKQIDKFWEKDNEIAPSSFAAPEGSKESFGHKLPLFSKR
ncbi:hypothetical protein MMC10_002417 [Thelotrema lepadinum]|nr:hypothetical protein [Thelotrema lepadinum]